MIFLDMRPLNKPEVFIACAGNLFEDGKLTDDVTAERLGRLGCLVRATVEISALRRLNDAAAQSAGIDIVPEN